MARVLYYRAKRLVKKKDIDIGLEYLTKAVAIDRDYIKRLYNDDNKSKHDKNNPFKNVEEDLRFKRLNLTD